MRSGEELSNFNNTQSSDAYVQSPHMAVHIRSKHGSRARGAHVVNKNKLIHIHTNWNYEDLRAPNECAAAPEAYSGQAYGPDRAHNVNSLPTDSNV